MEDYKRLWDDISKNNFININKSFNDIGLKHHASYITNLMVANDVNKNYQFLKDVDCSIDNLVYNINRNVTLKRKIMKLLNGRYKIKLVNNNFCLSKNELSNYVYQQAYGHYFKIDDKNVIDLLYDKALRYRIISNFMKSDIERILLKIQEDTEIIVLDTNNLKFLWSRYKKVNNQDVTYNCIIELIEKSLKSLLIHDNSFDEEYFENTRKINFLIKNYF